MPISIHLPSDVLRKVDQRAKILGLSRSGYIAQALRRDAEPETGWSPSFLDELRDVDPALREEADMLVAVVRRRRSRKAAPRRRPQPGHSHALRYPPWAWASSMRRA